MGLLDNIKNDIKKSGSNKGKILYVREGVKTRIRFLEDMDEGHVISFHDSFQKGINVPCQEQFGRDCPYCEDEDLRTRDMYAWSVYDVDSNSVKIMLYAVNNCSPIPALVSMYETYGTLTDRDYIITVSGKRQNKTFSVVPMDKSKFRNTKVKAYSEKALLNILDKAYPADGGDDDDEDYKPKKKTKKTTKVVEDDWEDENDDYEEMSSKELYQLCKERDISCKPHKSESYYIKLLNEADEEENEEDEWEDEENNYEDMSAKELYSLCKERKIECQAKKNARYYINLLEEDDQANEDWEDEDEEDWED